MELINPNMLWGLLAISAPILIHFWNQKKAVLINWAATKWLVESQKLKAKGFRFEDLLLLILRILAIIFLTLILAKPLINKTLWGSKKTLEKIHVIEKNTTVFDDFKFEINQALSKNEKVIFADENLEDVKTKDLDFLENKSHLIDLQHVANKINKLYHNKEIHYYLSSTNKFNGYPNLFLGPNFKLHISNSLNLNLGNVLKINQYIFVNDLLTKAELAPSGRKIIDKKNITVSINAENEDEINNIKAAFEAIAEVYGFHFEFLGKNQKSDISIGNLKIDDKSDLRIHTGAERLSGKYYDLNEKLDSRTSNLVFQATLPEKILEILLKHYEIDDFQTKLSQKQINGIFKKSEIRIKESRTLIDKYLIILLLTTIIAERWISLKNNK